MIDYTQTADHASHTHIKKHPCPFSFSHFFEHNISRPTVFMMCIRYHYEYRFCTNQGAGKKRHYRLGRVDSSGCPRRLAHSLHANYLYRIYGRNYLHYLPHFFECPYPIPSWGYDDSVCSSCARNLLRRSTWPHGPGGSGIDGDGSAEAFLEGRMEGWFGRSLG